MQDLYMSMRSKRNSWINRPKRGPTVQCNDIKTKIKINNINPNNNNKNMKSINKIKIISYRFHEDIRIYFKLIYI